MNSNIILFLLLFYSQLLFAQTKISIGTPLPHNSAALDISSSNKGFLIPRITQAARLAITNPTNGLLVYDSTSHRLYQFQEGEWRFMLTNESWTQANTRNFTYTTTSNIGIGLTSPTEKLDVNGKIQARGNVIAANNIDAGGNVTAANFTSLGSAVINGEATANGNVRTYSDLNVDNSNATVQLQNLNVKKTFFQIAGNDFKFGTNSNNTTGDIIFRMDNADAMTIDKNANIKLLNYSVHEGYVIIGWKLCRFAAPNINMLPVMIGLVPADGGGNGWISPFFGVTGWSKTGIGKYEITFSFISPNSAIVATPSETGRICTATYVSSGKFKVETFTRTGTPVDCAFTYMLNDPLL